LGHHERRSGNRRQKDASCRSRIQLIHRTGEVEIGLSLWQQFKDATWGFAGYARLARGRQSGFGYMAMLLAVVMVIAAMISTVQMGRVMAGAVRALQAAPDFALENGTFRFDGPMPYRVSQEDVTLVVDTTGKTRPEDLTGSGYGILITQHTLYQVEPGRIQETDLRRLPMALTKANVIDLIRALKWLVPVSYLFMYTFQLGFKALDGVVLALVAQVFGSIRGRRVPFGLGFHLGMYAMTLPVLLQWLVPRFTTVPWAGPMGKAGFVTWWGLAFLYLIMGLQAHFNAEDADSKPIPPLP
jgi:hypothetical protein